MTEVVMPKLGLTMETGVLVKWTRRDGETVEEGEVIAEIETEKTVYELEAPAGGILRIIVEAGEEVPVNEVLGLILAPDELYESGGASPQSAPAAMPPDQDGRSQEGPRERPQEGPRERPPSSPAARRLARDLGVDISLVTGTGPEGRIVEEDVRAFHERSGAGRKDTAPAEDQVRPAGPTPSQPGAVMPLSPMRKAIAGRMSRALRETAPVTLITDVDMSEAGRLLESLEEEFRARRLKLTYTHLLIKAAAMALEDHPQINVQWTEEGLVRLDSIHVGLAVALDDGLVVPVVKDAGQLPLPTLAARAAELVRKARERELKPEEISGGSITVTNLGMYDVLAFTPIINLPQSTILGVGKVMDTPVAREGRVEIRPVMYLSLVFDHRVVDGAQAADFLRRIKQLAENPEPLR